MSSPPSQSKSRSRRASTSINYSELNADSEEEEEEFEEEESFPSKKGSASKRRVVELVESDEEDDDDEEDEEEGEEEDEDDKSAAASSRSATKKTPSSNKKSRVASSSYSSSTSSKNKKNSNAPQLIPSSVDQILAAVRKDRSIMRKKAPSTTSTKRTSDLLLGVTEVTDLDTFEVSNRIEQLVVKTVTDIMNNNNAFEFDVPNRAASNQKYIEHLDRVCLGDKVSKRSFLNTSHVRKTAITTRVIELCHEVLAKQIHITKRDLFYTDVKLFNKQEESDAVLDDVACMVGCTRTSLHVVASDKGLVVGRIQYKEAGDEIDCTKMGIGGKAIPPYIDKITDIRSDAEFIILVEKEAAYMRLAEDRIYNKYPAIIITGKGQPDVATRLFLRKIRDQLQIPVLALVDSDPYGLKILSVYCSGSKAMSYDSSNLTTSDIKWLGVRPSDLDKYNLPAQCRLPLTDHDRKQGEELLKEEFIQKNPAWVKELNIMLASGEKAEIQALSSFGFQYITETFLPRKLLEGDWI